MSIFIITAITFLLTSIFLLIFQDMILVKYENISKYFYLVFFIIYAESVNNIWIQIYRVQFKSVMCNFIYDFVFKFLNLILLLFVFLNVLTFENYIISFTSLYFVRYVLFFIFYIIDVKIIKPDFSFINKETIRKAFHYSFFMFFSGLAGIITTTIDKLMLGAMLSLSIVGIYSIIITFPVLIRAVGGAFSMIAHARISEYWTKRELKKIESLYCENVNIQMFLGLFLFGIFTIFGREILLFLGAKYVQGYYAFILLMFGELVNISTGMCGGILSLSKHYKYDFYIRIILVLITIVTNIIFIPLWGLVGAAFATSIALVIYNVLKVVIVKWRIGLFPFKIENIYQISFSIIFFILIYFLQQVICLKNFVAIIVTSFVCFLIYLILQKYLFRMSFLKDLKHYVKK